MDKQTGVLTSAVDRRLALVIGSLCLIVLAFTTQMLLGLRRDVAHLRDELVTKDELANLAVCLGPADPAMATLEGTCTSCHTKERFEQAHGYDVDVHQLVTRMSELSGSHITGEEIPKVEAALTFMKCAHCHSQDRLKELAILSPRERWETIITMMREPGATISPEDAQRIRDFYGDYWGWHSP